MIERASLHGGGFRLVLRTPVSGKRSVVLADLFGPDGKINLDETPLQLETARTGQGRVLVVSCDTFRRISEMVAFGDADRTSIDVFREAPVRTYSRTAAAAILPDPDMFERLEHLGDALLSPGGGTPAPASMAQKPAAYTYLGQFLAHELTLWREIEREGSNHAAFLIDSAIDLKTIFLREPGYPATLPPHVGEWEDVLLGQTYPNSGAEMFGRGFVDLPRESSGKPLIIDKRNDQNLAVSQTHVAIARFACAALRLLKEDQKDHGESRRCVLRHFQSVVLQDYLPRIVDPATWTDVMMHGRVVVKPSGAKRTDEMFFVPPEFSGAIFRFGHVIRQAIYAPWNAINPYMTVDSAIPTDLLKLTYAGEGLRQTEERVPQSWVTDWRFMLGIGSHDPIKARAIGTVMGKDLFCLPAHLFQPSTHDCPCPASEIGNINLARRTLLAGADMRLPSGQDYARTVDEKLAASGSSCRIRVLTGAELNIPDNPDATAIMWQGKVGERFVDQTPLWLYTLREASLLGGGNHLGPLGSRIVAETISAAVEASGTEMIVDGILKPFEVDPRFGAKTRNKFDLEDLVRLAFKKE